MSENNSKKLTDAEKESIIASALETDEGRWALARAMVVGTEEQRHKEEVEYDNPSLMEK